MRGVGRYRAVLSPPGARPALGWSLVGRVSMSMNGLGVLLVARQALGSYGQAGLASAALAVAVAVATPQRARAADRLGPARVLRLSAVAHPGAIALFLLLAAVHAGAAALVASAAVIGLTMPPLTAVMRSLWQVLLEDRHLPTAYSLESAAAELCFISGPLVVAGLAATVGAGWALAVSGALAGTGSALLASLPFVRAVTAVADRPSHLAGPLVSPVVRTALTTLFLVGVGFGTTEVCVIAFAEEHGRSRAVAGVVLALWSFGSMVGGLLYGALHPATGAGRQLPAMAGLVGIGAALPAFAGGIGSLTVLVLLYGTAIAPFFACNALVVGEAAPPGTVTEAFAWSSSMVFAGAALGTGVAGHLIDTSGAAVAFRVAAVAGVLTVVVTVLGLGLSNRRATLS